MAAEQEMRDFTRGLFQGSPDLSVLTLAMVRSRYLAHVGRQSLVGEEKELLKQLVEEELLRMQLDDSSSDGGSPNPESARDAPDVGAEKRPPQRLRLVAGGPQGHEASSDEEDSGIDSRKPKLAPGQEDAGKSGHTGSCEDEGDSGAEETPDRGGAGRERDSEWAAGSEGTKQPPRRRAEGAEAQGRPGKKRAREAERRGDCGEQKGKANGGITAQTQEESGSESAVEEEECERQKQTGKTKRRSDSEEEGGQQEKGKDEGSGDGRGGGWEQEGDGERGRRKAKRGSESEEEEGKVQARQRGSSETDDDDSSSSSSAQDENNSPNPGFRRKKGKAPGSGGAGPAEEHPAVRRLKRYILACGVRRNYRKLLAGCRSVKQRVGVLRRELEAIGLQGNPSLERCRALRLRREEAAEVAALDVGNIIASDGRPRRRNIWSLYSTPPADPPVADGGPPARHPVDWSSLRGVISSDAESD
ncbi:LOW QUALITY PROTEIN: HIRA-interacting protein 3 [Chrysemys picta bellii]|uniref:LOW QUALITY PROTEIN: HIRA-interacting protein 3 n=1 Tax=Chrysemys picta bellii TaxID=8478 RepID=UPI0032B16ED1